MLRSRLALPQRDPCALFLKGISNSELFVFVNPQFNVKTGARGGGGAFSGMSAAIAGKMDMTSTQGRKSSTAA
jgi:hypothetical protein